MYDPNDVVVGSLLDLEYGPNDRPTAGEIKARWKELCKRHHPDHGGDEAEFRKVTHAYRMLTDAKYRAQESARIVREEDGNFRGDLDLQIKYEISFDDAFFGRSASISYSVNELDDNLEVIKQEVIRTESVRMNFPPGTTNGFTKNFEDQGNIMGAIRGDAQVITLVQPHPVFQLHGMSIHATQKFPLHILLKGGVVEVPTMYGIKPLRIPPGTKTGDELKIEGAGILNRGHHLVRVEMEYPRKKDLKGEDWKGLEIDWNLEDPPDEESEEYLNFFNQRYQKYRGKPNDIGYIK